MPRFPKAKNDILILAAKIADGIDKHPTDYPNPPFDPSPIQNKMADVLTQIGLRQAKEAEAKAALDTENDMVDDIAEMARHVLRLAEDKYPADAGKLHEIGWDIKSVPQSLPPGQVRDLELHVKGAGSVLVEWRAPEATAHVGEVRAYRVERQLTDIASRRVTEEWGVWHETAFKPEILLMSQPRAIEISYRVIATNTAGQGQPSDTETVVL